MIIRILKYQKQRIADKGGLFKVLKLSCGYIKKHGLLKFLKKVFFARFFIKKVDYLEWINQYDASTPEDLDKMRGMLEGFQERPLISVVMPVYNPKVEWLADAIESVKRQLYENWELCIADDCSTDRAVRKVLERFAGMDSRIRVVYRDKNGHICAATNTALSIAKGSWIALLDHDDKLHEAALFWAVHALNENPGAMLIYSDEDKIGSDGQRKDPYFKPDWNPDLFYSQNMISHLGMYRHDVVKRIGGFREGFEGAQDHDLALRVVEQIDSTGIIHIPKVLYHWRAHEGSTALVQESKPYAFQAGERALNEHFARLNMASRAEYNKYGYRVTHELPEIHPLVDVIIPTKDNVKYLKKCIKSILELTEYDNYRVTIVDNGSRDPETVEYLNAVKEEKRITVIQDNSPFNFSAINNRAVEQSAGEVLAFVNDDIEVITPRWLKEMVSHALRPGVGAVGARLWYSNDTLQHGGVICGVGGVANHAHKHIHQGDQGYFGRAVLIQNYSAVTAACMVIRKEVFEQAGGFNEEDLAVAFNDVDLCLRLVEAGYWNVWTPYAELYHHESVSRGDDNDSDKVDRFCKEIHYMKEKWGKKLLFDPAYNVNLSLEDENFGLDFSGRNKVRIQ